MPPFDPTDQGTWSGSPFTLPDYRAIMANADKQRAFDTLIGAGMGLAQASAPSPYPTDWATAFGGLGSGAGMGAMQGQQRAQQTALGQMQLGQMGLQQQMMQQGMQALPQLMQQGGAAPSPPQGAQPSAPTSAGAPIPFNIGNVKSPQGAFAQPASLDDGINLAVTTAKAYPAAFNNGRPMTLAQIGQHWAPASDNNDPIAWAGNVAKIGGLDPNQPVDLSDPATAAKFARGVHGAEWGAGKVQPLETYQSGVSAALGGKPVQLAQAGPAQGGAMPGFPGAPPDPSRYAPLLMNPVTKALGESLMKRDQQQYEYQMKRYEAAQKLREMQRTEANAPVTPGGAVNPSVIEAATQKKVGESTATETARKKAIFGSDDWENKSPEELRKTVNPEALSLVEQVQSGQTKMADISARSGTGGISVTKNDVLALGKKLYGEEWDPNAGDRRQKFEMDTIDQSSQTGKTLYSINTVYKHLDRYQDVTDAINNHNTPVLNEILRQYNNAAGYQKYSTPEALQHALGTEIAAVIKGQQLNEPEVDNAVDTLKTTKSPEQMHGALGILRHAMGDRESTIKYAAARAKVPAGRIAGLIDPDAQQAVRHFDEKQVSYNQPPPEALSKLQEGHVTTFGNGQKWTLQGGKPARVQ